MPIQTTSENTLQARTEIAHKNECNELTGVIERYLRKRFDNAHVDATAIAIIQLAEEEELFDLVEEMKADYYTETGRKVVA